MKNPSSHYWARVEWLHIQTLAAIMRYRAWQSKEIAFQGGTALHLGHGSPRLSEDIDFLLDRNRDPEPMMRSVARTVGAAALQAFRGRVEFKPGRADRNPRTYTLKLIDPDLPRKVVLKCEFWHTRDAFIACYRKQPRLVMLPPGILVTPFSVPTADLEEIYLDKLHALVARRYPKVRDLFDLWWLATQSVVQPIEQDRLAETVENHLAMYDGPPETLEAFARMLREQGASRFDALSDEAIASDLKRWLPDSLDTLLTPGMIGQMRDAARSACLALADAIDDLNLQAEQQP